MYNMASNTTTIEWQQWIQPHAAGDGLGGNVKIITTICKFVQQPHRFIDTDEAVPNNTSA